MDAVGAVILGAVVLALVAIVVLARRRRWNSDGSDDLRRRGLGMEGGMPAPWRKAADDPRYAQIAPPSPAGWLAGQGALGVPSSAEMKAAAVRSVWLDDDAAWPVATHRLVIRHPDGIPPTTLAVAARKALKSAEGAMPGRGSVRARAEWRDVAGPLAESVVHIHVRGAGADGPAAEKVARAFADAFIGQLAREGNAASLAE